MTTFDDAARKAAGSAFDVIRHIIAEHPDMFEKTNETHWAARDVLQIEITKHYADLAETFKKLVWVAYLADHYIASIRQDFYEEDKDSAWVDLTTAVADPAIVALLAEKG